MNIHFVIYNYAIDYILQERIVSEGRVGCQLGTDLFQVRCISLYPSFGQVFVLFACGVWSKYLHCVVVLGRDRS